MTGWWMVAVKPVHGPGRAGRPHRAPKMEGPQVVTVIIIAYRILLTIFVTVASSKMCFSKLKLLKSYLCSTMTQERLNGLVIIAIENDILEINNEDMIEDFISKNTRRMLCNDPARENG